MLAPLRNSVYSRILWGLIGAYVLNFSVDNVVPASYTGHLPGGKVVNEQESIVEILLEKVLGYENAIAEHQDQTNEDSNKKKNSKIDQILFAPSYAHGQLFSGEREFPVLSFPSLSGYFQIEPPPPRI